MSQSIDEIKEEMCEIGRRIWQRGYCAGNEGNHSVRLSEDRVLTTPTCVSKGFLTPEMLCTVDMDGHQIDTDNRWKRTSEVLIHLAIYRKRADVKAVVHAHPPHVTAFACAGVPIPEGIHPEAEVFLGKVISTPYATPGKRDLADSILPLIEAETSSLVLGNHGSVHFASNLTNAYYNLEVLDSYCRLLMLVRQFGQISVFNAPQMEGLMELKTKFGFADPRIAAPPDSLAVAQKGQGYFAGMKVRPAGK